MIKKRIKWGILGTSFISEVMAHAIQASETSQLVGVASRSSDIAKEFANKFAIPTFVGDYQTLINDPNIDAIYIGLPNHLHKEWIIRCAQAGKHILCEKPLVLTAKEAEEVIAVVEKENVFCMEALMYRCHPFTKNIQELIDSNLLGDIKLYTATYTANIVDKANTTAGGSIRNLGCYPVSLVRLLAKSEPIQMQAMGRLHAKNNNDSQASILLKFADGAMAVVSTADDIEMHWQFEIYGTKGRLKMLSNPWLPNHENNRYLLYREDEANPTEINITANKPLYTYQIDTVNTHIINGQFKSREGISLQDSLGNITVLETWLKQIQA